MKKNIFIFCFGLLACFCLPLFLFSESMTLSTYYPSPKGIYSQVEVTRGLIFKPQSLVPNPSAQDKEGEMVYVDSNPFDSAPGQFYLFGGGSWAAPDMGGGGSGLISLKYPKKPAQAGTPQACPAGWTDLGTGSVAVLAGSGWPNYYGYDERWCYKSGVTAFSLKCPGIAQWATNPNSACVPPACPAGWNDAGTGCLPINVGAAGYNGFCERWCYK